MSRTSLYPAPAWCALTLALVFTSEGAAQTRHVAQNSPTHQHQGATMTTDTLLYRGPETDSFLAANNDEAIRPFRVSIPQPELDDLRRRILATRFPEKEPVNDFSQGVPLATVRKLAEYWANEYDWRRVEAQLNALPQFITNIDGLDIHFVHVRSKHPNALPVIITHGWPGSIIEQLKLVGPLTDPTAFGGRAEDAFDVIIPSMPGYGFSGRPAETGWGPKRIARAWITLMRRLGYDRFVAQGGDWGAIVVDEMALLGAPELAGIHTNMAGVIPPDIDAAAFAGKPAPAGLSAEERDAYERLLFVYSKGIGYAFQLGLRPQSMYGLADSPVGLAGYLLDHDARSLELIARVFDGKREGLTRDDVLDNITLTYLTNTGISSGRLYAENTGSFFGVKGVTIPVAVSAFQDELYVAPRSWAEQAYPNLVFYNRHDRGGHFAAWEQPELLTADIRAGFRTLR
jgi:pimeloyl-ACP methyl ester carboxylesterase